MKYRYKRFLLRLPLSRISIGWMKKIRFPKHENVSLYKIIKLFIRNLAQDEILDRANGVAFNFILAIFPAIIFLFTLIPYVSNFFPEITTDSIMEFMREMVPANMYDVLSTTVLDIVSNQRGGLLTFGFIFAVYLSTNGMMALMRAFNACYRTTESRGGLKTRLIATFLTLTMAFVLFLAIILLVVGQVALDYVSTRQHLVDLSDFTVFLIFVLRFVVIFIAFFLAISTIYYFGPAIHYNWRFFSMGSIIATVLCIVVSYGFSYYVTNFSTYNKVYGSIGVLIALMAWIQIMAIVLLVGYEINATLHDSIRMEALWNSRHNRNSKFKIQNSKF